MLLQGHSPSVKGYQLLPEPGGCWTRTDSGVAPDRRPGQGYVSPGLPACGVAPDRCPSLGVGQSRPTAQPFARRWAAECSLYPASAPVLELRPTRQVRAGLLALRLAPGR